ncbi:MAG: hypothetical protein PVJ02_11300 [Gemmatimonadota bacterium]|jgi:hypothetical protein
MIEPMVIVAMIFTLIVLAMIGGFILLFPLSRQLSTLLHQRLQHGDAPPSDERVDALAQAVEMLSAEVERLADRQDFTERLLERPHERTGPDV